MLKICFLRKPVWIVIAGFMLASCALFKPRQNCPAEYKVDFKETLLFLDKADLAYQSADSIQRACGKDSCFIFDGAVTKARAVVERNDSSKVQWIAFRGTALISDVVLDADYTARPDSNLGIYLHSGFAAAANDLLPMMLPVLRPGYQTNISGHSLGGAIAVISALRLQNGFKVKVYTFGQPKTTNLEGAARQTSLDLTRFIDDRDIVALMPPLDWKPGQALGSYAHFGREIDLQTAGYACLERHCDDISLDYWKKEAQKQAFEDHGIAKYRAKILVLAAPYVNP